MGADGVPPSEKLKTGPRVGSEGIVPADQPAQPEHSARPLPP